MTTDRLNLSRRPFVNNRPVTRAAILLWALGFLLLLVNVFSFWSYLESSREKRAEVKAGEAKLAAERQAISRREGQVAQLDLGRQNDEVAYLNGKIAQRTFSWSQLLDRVSETMPNDVRLQRLSPQGLADEREERQVRRTSARRPTPDRVTLQIDGQARSDEAILELVDNLFAHPAFAEPNLTHETHEGGGLIRFNLSVVYLPNAPVTGAVRPPARHWRLAPEPGSPQLQAGAPAAPAPGAPRLVPPPALPPNAAAPAPDLRIGPLARPAARPNDDPLRGIGTPQRQRTPPPQEGGVPREGGRR
jgi:hypothetical protein